MLRTSSVMLTLSEILILKFLQLWISLFQIPLKCSEVRSVVTDDDIWAAMFCYQGYFALVTMLRIDMTRCLMTGQLRCVLLWLLDKWEVKPANPVLLQKIGLNEFLLVQSGMAERYSHWVRVPIIDTSRLEISQPVLYPNDPKYSLQKISHVICAFL